MPALSGETSSSSRLLRTWSGIMQTMAQRNDKYLPRPRGRLVMTLRNPLVLWAILVVVFLAIWQILNGQSGSSGRDAAAGGAMGQGASGSWLTVVLPVTFMAVLFILFRAT